MLPILARLVHVFSSKRQTCGRSMLLSLLLWKGFPGLSKAAEQLMGKAESKSSGIFSSGCGRDDDERRVMQSG